MNNLDKAIEALQKLNIAVKNADGSFRDFKEVILDLNEAWEDLDREEQKEASSAVVKYGFETLKI